MLRLFQFLRLQILKSERNFFLHFICAKIWVNEALNIPKYEKNGRVATKAHAYHSPIYEYFQQILDYHEYLYVDYLLYAFTKVIFRLVTNIH